MSAAYIVANDLLKTNPPLGSKEWHAHGIPADPLRSLLVVEWDNQNTQMEFEALADVLPLGAPWEPLPAEAAPLLESLSDPARVAVTATMVVEGAPAQPDTVKTALQKIAWSGARSVR